MLDFLHHLLFPRESNNHRAGLLHFKPLLILVIALLLMSYLTPVVERQYPDILGISANISVADLVNLTNQKRAENGLPALNLNSQLSNAAMNKANDMLAKNYWSHNAPDGTTPWFFIKTAGYDYLYAGENLARGFTTAGEAMDAWMASPGHKENILSPKYKDVGFAVVTGNLTGDETVLIVQEFGERMEAKQEAGSAQAVIIPTAGQIQITETPKPTFIAQAMLPSVSPIPTILPTPTIVPTFTPAPIVSAVFPNEIFVASVNKEPAIEKDVVIKNIALSITLFFIYLFFIDMLIIERKKIIRLVSHSTDHIIFLTLIVIAIILYNNTLII